MFGVAHGNNLYISLQDKFLFTCDVGIENPGDQAAYGRLESQTQCGSLCLLGFIWVMAYQLGMIKSKIANRNDDQKTLHHI